MVERKGKKVRENNLFLVFFVLFSTKAYSPIIISDKGVCVKKPGKKGSLVVCSFLAKC